MDWCGKALREHRKSDDILSLFREKREKNANRER